MNLGKTLKELRLKQRFFQEQAAGLIGTSQPVISDLECNRLFPSQEMLVKLSNIYKTPIPVIFFMAIDEKDVKKSNLEFYRESRAEVDRWVEDVFLK